MQKTLRPDKVIKTIELLKLRIEERFPDAGLVAVVGELADNARGTDGELRQLARADLGLRLLVGLLTAVVIGLVVAIPFLVVGSGLSWSELTYDALINVLEPTLGASFFVTAFLVFLMSIERNRKRSRILTSLYDYRALAHVIDMHQLTKDPQVLLHHEPTPSSPKRDMSPFELNRYYDYCSEGLALISKVSSIYAERFPDQVVTTAVDEIEGLTTGLSQKVWQKTTVLRATADLSQGSSGGPEGQG